MGSREASLQKYQVSERSRRQNDQARLMIQAMNFEEIVSKKNSHQQNINQSISLRRVAENKDLPSIREDPDLEHVADSEQIEQARIDDRRHEEEKLAANFINISEIYNQARQQALNKNA